MCVDFHPSYRHHLAASSLHQSSKRYKTQEICYSSPQSLIGKDCQRTREELGQVLFTFLELFLSNLQLQSDKRKAAAFGLKKDPSEQEYRKSKLNINSKLRRLTELLIQADCLFTFSVYYCRLNHSLVSSFERRFFLITSAFLTKKFLGDFFCNSSNILTSFSKSSFVVESSIIVLNFDTIEIDDANDDVLSFALISLICLKSIF